MKEYVYSKGGVALFTSIEENRTLKADVNLKMLLATNIRPETFGVKLQIRSLDVSPRSYGRFDRNKKL